MIYSFCSSLLLAFCAYKQSASHGFDARHYELLCVFLFALISFSISISSNRYCCWKSVDAPDSTITEVTSLSQCGIHQRLMKRSCYRRNLVSLIAWLFLLLCHFFSLFFSSLFLHLLSLVPFSLSFDELVRIFGDSFIRSTNTWEISNQCICDDK